MKAEELKALKDESGLTYNEIAARVNLSLRTIEKYARGERNIPDGTGEKLIAAVFKGPAENAVTAERTAKEAMLAVLCEEGWTVTSNKPGMWGSSFAVARGALRVGVILEVDLVDLETSRRVRGATKPAQKPTSSTILRNSGALDEQRAVRPT